MKLRTEKTEYWIKKTDGEGNVAEFLVEPLSAKESFDLAQDSVAPSVGRNQTNQGPDLYLFKIKKINRVIKGWKSIEDENGKPLECTNTMKEIIYNFNRDMIDEVLDEADRLADIRQKQIEADQKN